MDRKHMQIGFPAALALLSGLILWGDEPSVHQGWHWVITGVLLYLHGYTCYRAGSRSYPVGAAGLLALYVSLSHVTQVMRVRVPQAEHAPIDAIMLRYADESDRDTACASLMQALEEQGRKFEAVTP